MNEQIIDVDINARNVIAEEMLDNLQAQPWVTLHCQRCGAIVSSDNDLVTLVENPKLVDPKGGRPHIKQWGIYKICHNCKTIFDILFIANKPIPKGGMNKDDYCRYILDELKQHIPEFWDHIQQTIAAKRKKQRYAAKVDEGQSNKTSATNEAQDRVVESSGIHTTGEQQQSESNSEEQIPPKD